MNEIDFASGDTSLRVTVTSLVYVLEDSQVRACRIELCIPYAQYRKIEDEELFNLATEIQVPLSGRKLSPAATVTLEADLQPDMLPQLLAHASTSDEALAFLSQLSRSRLSPGSPALDNVIPLVTKNAHAMDGGRGADLGSLVHTDSWYCRSVTQTLDDEEVGYRTFWSYFLPAPPVDENALGQRLSAAIVEFVRDALIANLSPLLPDSLADAGDMVRGFIEELATGSIFDEDDEEGDPAPTSTALFARIVDFFRDDGWPFEADPEGCALRTECRGFNGQWTCVAYALEDAEQVLFYSICPIAATPARLAAVCEFVARANTRAAIGNFEMDCDTGQIAYKTSIDVQGDRISSALLSRLVYINVSMMGTYLPRITSVIEDEVEPAQAIAEIGSEEIPA